MCRYKRTWTTCWTSLPCWKTLKTEEGCWITWTTCRITTRRSAKKENQKRKQASPWQQRSPTVVMLKSFFCATAERAAGGGAEGGQREDFWTGDSVHAGHQGDRTAQSKPGVRLSFSQTHVKIKIRNNRFIIIKSVAAHLILIQHRMK